MHAEPAVQSRTAALDAATESPAAVRELAVREFRETDRAQWNDFVHAQPQGTFFHLAEWQDVLQRSFGHASHYMLAESGGRIRGVLPLAQVKSRLFGHSLVSAPFCVYGGALAVDESAHCALEAAACDLGRRLQVDFVEFRNRERRHPDWPCSDLNFTFRKSILETSDANMLAIPRKQRAMVRKGIKAELRSEVDAGVDRYYRIYSESMRNLGTPVFSKRYARVMKDVFGAACDIVTVMGGDQEVASVLNFYFRDEVLPYYGGGTPAARAVAGNDFMYWEVMNRARERGCRIFDFGRSKRDTGAFEFKTHWGFEPTPLYYEYFLVGRKEMPNVNRMNPRFHAAISTWQRLPVSVTRLIGPPVAKYLV